MTDLIQALQEAGEGSRELDAAVCDAVNWRKTDGFWTFPAPVSRSLDAALALAELVLDDPKICVWNSRNGKAGATAAVGLVDAGAATLPLALCIAVLKALRTKDTA
jgi:hypothetical protein